MANTQRRRKRDASDRSQEKTSQPAKQNDSSGTKTKQDRSAEKRGPGSILHYSTPNPPKKRLGVLLVVLAAWLGLVGFLIYAASMQF